MYLEFYERSICYIGAIFCVVLLIQVVLFIAQNSIVTELHELQHAKALQSFGFETLVLLPQSKKKPIKNKNGVKIVYTDKKACDAFYRNGITLVSDDFQTLTNDQIQKAAGAGLYSSIRYLIIQLLSSMTSIIYTCVYLGCGIATFLFIMVSVIVIILTLPRVIKCAKCWKNAKNDYTDFNDVTAFLYPERFKLHYKELENSFNGSVYEYYYNKFAR